MKDMTQEDKKLLLKDLCARLPYGVKIELMPITKGKCTTLTPIILHDYYISDDVNYLPYLRPMSSMTEDEKKEYRKTQINKWVKSVDCTGGGYYEHRDTLKTFDWLNAHHFDYRGLIEKGLALEALEGMYDLNDK